MPASAILAIAQASRRPFVGLPHYGPRGEIYAVNPGDVHVQMVTFTEIGDPPYPKEVSVLL